MKRRAPSRTVSSTGPLKTLDRILSKAGLASRTQARELIAAGRVRVNGRGCRSL